MSANRHLGPEIRSLQARLAELVQRLPAAHVQNKLMASTDRNLALALLGCNDDFEKDVLARIATAKADRVRQELAITERRRVDGEHVRYALRLLIESLETNQTRAGRPSYWRPRRSEERTGR